MKHNNITPVTEETREQIIDDFYSSTTMDIKEDDGSVKYSIDEKMFNKTMLVSQKIGDKWEPIFTFEFEYEKKAKNRTEHVQERKAIRKYIKEIVIKEWETN